MKFQQLVTLLPCHSLEDFPVYAVGDEAHGLLTAWTAPWHPSLIAMSGKQPSWCRRDDVPDAMRNTLFFLPGGGSDAVSDVVQRRVTDEGCALISGFTDRTQCVAAALAEADVADVADQEVVCDFLALGYWYLQIQLLTRQMRHTSNIDEEHFAEQLVAAANHLVAGDSEAGRDRLSRCYGVLAEERDHYYPVEAYLIDLTLVAETTPAEKLAAELHGEAAVNIWLTGRTLQKLAAESPQNIHALRAAINEERVTLVGGEMNETALPLQSCENILEEFHTATDVFDRTLAVRPAHFARRRFGMAPRLPQILERLRYEGAIHPTLDDGRFPEGNQTRTRWSGLDGSTVEAICGVPCDAVQPETFLRLAMRIGESMEYDYVATVCLAHWAGQASPWYDDLRRGTRYGLALGQFATLARFFQDTGYTGQLDEFTADQYRSPYLRQAAQEDQPNPITRWVDYWHFRAAIEATHTLRAWVSMLNPRHEAWPTELPTTNVRTSKLATDAPAADDVRVATDALHEAAAALAPLLACDQTISNTVGKLLLNPTSAASRVPLALVAASDKPVYATGEIDGVARALVDVPAHGFAWVPARDDGAVDKAIADAKHGAAVNLANDNLMRNEFCEVHIDTDTGGLRAIYDFHNRGNRLSQQLALRLPGNASEPHAAGQPADEQTLYSTMKSRRCEVTCSSTVLAEITTAGELLDIAGNQVAEFTQRFRLWRGSRQLQIQIELTPQCELTADPWNSYYACRFAWANESSLLYRDVNQSRQLTNARRIEAPLYIEIDGSKQRTAILTGGLPFHRRVDKRRLDTLLITRGETRRRFQLAIGVDCRSLLADAWSVLVPTTAVDHCGPARASSSWLFHIDARHVVATHWSPKIEAVDDEPRSTGACVRLLETLGRDALVTLQAFRPIKSACRQNFRGEQTGLCEVVNGRVQVKMQGDEWTQIEVCW